MVNIFDDMNKNIHFKKWSKIVIVSLASTTSIGVHRESMMNFEKLSTYFFFFGWLVCWYFIRYENCLNWSKTNDFPPKLKHIARLSEYPFGPCHVFIQRKIYYRQNYLGLFWLCVHSSSCSVRFSWACLLTFLYDADISYFSSPILLKWKHIEI